MASEEHTLVHDGNNFCADQTQAEGTEENNGLETSHLQSEGTEGHKIAAGAEDKSNCYTIVSEGTLGSNSLETSLVQPESTEGPGQWLLHSPSSKRDSSSERVAVAEDALEKGVSKETRDIKSVNISETKQQTKSCLSRFILVMLTAPCVTLCTLEASRRYLPPPHDACGGLSVCRRCDGKLGVPLLARWKCGECNTGYHSVGKGICDANECSCRGGVACSGASCDQDGAEKCSVCEHGFYRVAGVCKLNQCSCAGGTALNGSSCKQHGDEMCKRCDVGFHLTGVGGSCMRNHCTCLGGPALNGSGCDENDAERCGSCSDGLHLVLNSCAKNLCHCNGGSPMTGQFCDRDGAERCSECDTGFHHVGSLCKANQCSCLHGKPAGPGPPCNTNGAEVCRTCDVGFHMIDGATCSENQCRCRGGVARVGKACPENDAWKCNTCNDGFHLQSERCDAFVHVFDSGDYMRIGKAAPPLVSDMRALGHHVTPFSTIDRDGWNASSYGVLILPELFNKLILRRSTSQALQDWILRGGHFMICGDYFGHNARFLNAVFGWNLQGVLSYSNPSMRPSCGIFCGGPAELEWDSEVSCYAPASLPEGAREVYNDANSVCVFTLKHGIGRITYVGFDWYNSNRSNWTRVLHLAVLGSG